ncbi:YigZ family protein [Glutamicibacter sp. X7]
MSSENPAASRYTTIATDVLHEVEIKRSRFITYLRRVSDEPAARELVAELRKSYFDARHHCSAFVLGADRMVQRSSDDGEPSGTAGIPMLEALTKRDTGQGTDLSDIVAVCVRYFGGIKLGAGGLVRAYSDSVSQALEQAQLLRVQRMHRYTLDTTHAQAPRYENELRAAGFQVGETTWHPESAQLMLAIADEPGRKETLETHIASLTAGTGTLNYLDQRWVDLP